LGRLILPRKGNSGHNNKGGGEKVFNRGGGHVLGTEGRGIKNLTPWKVDPTSDQELSFRLQEEKRGEINGKGNLMWGLYEK